MAAQVGGESRPMGGCVSQELPTEGPRGKAPHPQSVFMQHWPQAWKAVLPTLQVNSGPPSYFHLGLALGDLGREGTLNCCPAT